MTLIMRVTKHDGRWDKDNRRESGSNACALIELRQATTASVVPRRIAWSPMPCAVMSLTRQQHLPTLRHAMLSMQPFHEAYCIAKRRDAADISSG